MRIVFFGSDDFAAICLNELLKSSVDVVGIVTGPDTRQGRGMKITLSPIKEIALEHDIVCLQPASLKEEGIVEQLQAFQADIFVVVAYGRLLPQVVLDIPKIFCVNVHGSLLPQYRGPAPIHWAILNGDQVTGPTIQKMALKLDAGDILSQEKMTIEPKETSGQLRLRMAELGAKLLVRTLKDIKANQHKLTPQNEAQVTYAPKLAKEMGQIDWNKPAQTIDHHIRGLQPWPSAYTHYKGKLLKILEASVVAARGQAGTITDLRKEGFVVACAENALLITKVHLEASKATSAYDFLQGHRLQLNDRLE